MRISDWSSDVCSSDLQPWRSPLTSEAVAAPPPSRLDPLASERASLVSLRGGKGFGILLRTRRIGFQELGLGNGETREDQRLSEIAAFHGPSRHRPTIARAVGEPDLGVGFAQNPRDRKSLVEGKSVSVSEDPGG